jgi:hypothetical protein
MMTDLLNLAMLICASIGAMGFGILSAYWVLRICFALMRPRAQRIPAKASAEVASAS